jgi:energy-converting hydrogenase B subunit J
MMRKLIRRSFMVLETTAAELLQATAPNLFGQLYLGPLLWGFIIGFLAGVIMHKTPTNGIKLNTSSWIAIIIGGILVAFWLGTFPYYSGLPLGPGFVVAIIGAIIGRTILGTKNEA